MGVAAIPVVGVSVLFAYGYWHAKTHAAVYVDTRDLAGRFVQPADGALTFRDRSGRVLAQFAPDDSRMFVLSGPYSCRDIERRASFEVGGHAAYAQCFERQSRWQATWARDVTHADVSIGGCRWDTVPVSVSIFSGGPNEWAAWWVPFPHGGGSRPYTQFQITVTVKSVC